MAKKRRSKKAKKGTTTLDNSKEKAITTVDLRCLEPWNGDMTILGMSFDLAMPGAASSRLVRRVSEHPECLRLMLSDDDKTMCIDFFSTPVALMCPDSVPHFEHDAVKASGGVPLIPVRYLLLGEDLDSFAEISVASIEDGVLPLSSESGFSPVKVSGEGQVLHTLRMLEANSKHLNMNYLQHFESLSPNHHARGFKASFLVPPLYEDSESPSCSHCHVSGWVASLKCCARCQSVRYCGVACQKAHWKAGHKAECGTKTTSREAVAQARAIREKAAAAANEKRELAAMEAWTYKDTSLPALYPDGPPGWLRNPQQFFGEVFGKQPLPGDADLLSNYDALHRCCTYLPLLY